MKYVIILADGMAGEPLEELQGQTTLEAADTPMMDELAKEAEIGMACMIPDDMEPGSDVANLSVLGYDPHIYYTGRSSLEALSLGIDLEEDDVAFRANFVTLSGNETLYEKKKIIDHSAGEISTKEAGRLIYDLGKKICRKGYALYPGTSYRNLLVQKNGKMTNLTPPHNILLQEIKDHLPKDKELLRMMKESYDILKNHPVNIKRRERGENTADTLWFWGEAQKTSLSSFYKRTGKKAAMISAVDLLRGIANGAGIKNIMVEGATGGLHTNYKGKAEAAVQALKEKTDLVYIHIEAPDEMGHLGLAASKIQAIESIDCEIIKTVVSELRDLKEQFRILILPDHPTPVCKRTHTREAVPYLLYESDLKRSGQSSYNEKTGRKSGIYLKEGYHLIDRLIRE